MASYRFEPFDGGNFIEYSERLEAYFLAHDIGIVAPNASREEKRTADHKKVAFTISLLGKKTYSTLKDLCLPDNPTDKSYEQLTQLLKDHFKPKSLVVAETCRFYILFKVKLNLFWSMQISSRGRLLHVILVHFYRKHSETSLWEVLKKLLSEERTFQQAVDLAQADCYIYWTLY